MPLQDLDLQMSFLLLIAGSTSLQAPIHHTYLSLLSVIQCVTDFKKRGNGGTVGTANVSGGLSGGTCTPVFFRGNSNSQIGRKTD